MRWMVLVALALCVGCATTPRVVDAAERQTLESQVAATLVDFHEAASVADEARYFAHLTGDAVFMGTDKTERWDVAAFQAYVHPFFSEGKGWTMHSLERHVSLSDDGRLAWFDERLVHTKYGELRGSGVLRWAEDRWKVTHYVLSFPVPNDVAGEVVRIIAEHGDEEVSP